MPSSASRLVAFALVVVFALSISFTQAAPAEIVLRTSGADAIGAWTPTADPSAAGGQSLRHPDRGAPKLSGPLATPQDYFELSFDAETGVPYRVWLRGKADGNSWANDSVYVQFSTSVTSGGAPVYRTGTASAATVTIEDCTSCGLSGWGWQDSGFGANVLGPAIYFGATGVQTIRVQTREDGLAIDQIVISPLQYFTAPPGPPKRDTTILTPTGGGPAPAVTLVRGPYLQQAAATSVVVVWATLESGDAQVRYAPPAQPGLDAPATSRLVPASQSGLAFNYYHHEATLTPLLPSATYQYQLLVNGSGVGSGAVYTLTTAPPAGAGVVRFAAFGDSGTGSAAQHQIAALLDASVNTFDIVLHGGDIAYGNSGGTGDGSYQTLHDWFFGIYDGWLPSRPFFPVEGNHDSRPSNGNGPAYLDMYSLFTNGASGGFPDHAERYYSFDYGPVHFVALDTEFAFQDSTRRTEQLSWLASDLAGSAQPWKVAFFHRSPFSAGGEHGSDFAVRNAFAPLFEQYGVRLALSAHEHDYERTVPTSVSGGPPVVYIVSGGGGAPLYTAATAAWTAYSASRYHYVRATADECTLTVDAIGLDAAIFDTTTLTRCEDPGDPEDSTDIVLYATDATTVAGAWTLTADATAADGFRLRHPDAGAPKAPGPLATPVHYFDVPFQAVAGVPYKLWLRAKADGNHWANDSVYVQFTSQVGTTGASTMTLENCTGCGVSGWGWQDDAFGVGVAGPTVTFATSGPQQIRIQTREDGLSIDQIVLSPDTYLTTAPGALKKDVVIVPR